MRSLMVAVCFFVFAVAAFAQGDLGAIAGAVTDWEHAVVSDAAIEAKNVKTGTVYKATSSATGNYTLSQLPAGTYELSVRVPGLRAYRQQDIVVQAAQTLRLDVRLEYNVSLNTLGEDRAFFAARGSPHATPSGPTPRTPDGKPDLSGVWHSPRNVDPEQPAMLPWAAALFRERRENYLKDLPSARCLPAAVALLAGFGVNKLIQTPALLVILTERVPGYQQVFLDGRGHPQDMDPTWTGHSIGHWEGDTLVVDTVGFNGKTWLTLAGNPLTEKLHMTTRFRRPDLGHLEIEVTHDDPGTFTKPWKIKQVADLAENEEVQEYICNENNQDVEHLVGK